MGWQLPPLNALRAFEAAGRYSGFTLAADELCVTPGAVSRQIKLLEATLGLQLFVRHNREVRLTAESAMYLNALTDAFRRLDGPAPGREARPAAAHHVLGQRRDALALPAAAGVPYLLPEPPGPADHLADDGDDGVRF